MLDGENTMTPAAFHVAPRPSLASHRVSTVLSAIEIFFSLSSVKKPIWRPSGDQNGRWPFSVPGSGRGVSESIDRS